MRCKVKSRLKSEARLNNFVDKGGNILKLVRDAEACYGCRTCELVCSFHHSRVFSPELSSMKVLTHMRTGEIKWTIDSTCDSCQGEAQPLCVKYCIYGALQEAK